MTAALAAAFAVETRGLTKRFGAHAAVDDVHLAVPRGSVFGFLGPNGSGKTTTIRMLLGLASATAGEIRVLGRDMPHELNTVLPQVGALVEGPAFYPFLSGAANLHRLDTANRYAPGSTRNTRVRDALARVGLGHAEHKKVHAYSLGMKQRLGLANALLSPRELLVLDEPTNGLDPQGTREVRHLVRSLAADGATVFVSSHLLSEIEQICTHVGVMSAGRLVSQGTLDELRSTSDRRVRVVTPDPEAATRVLSGLGMQPVAFSESDLRPGDVESGVTAGLTDSVAPEEVVAALVTAGVRVRGFELVSSTLEERFVELTGEGFDVVQ
ncbi:ATP-binding cassette domain-containing protein [Homoserinimonas sp. OAct 916]|uniref:ABC transporter ATP-binding protein n=1 Tax=Homoserinimonas sp. OAct 916 TaxID=2211450 RepID=UPI000DBE1AF1|nr:ATP-binding cassette domain-containing protein [Homoserinimonas sp. OAct 916]